MTSWWWAQQCSKHVEEYNKLVIKQEFVHQVGQLLRLYWDAQSAKRQNTQVSKVNPDNFQNNSPLKEAHDV